MSLSRRIFFGLAILTVMIVNLPILIHMGSLWLYSSAHHHALLALPVSSWLIMRRGIDNGALPVNTQFFPTASVLIVPALGFAVLGASQDIKLLSHASIVLLIIAAFIASFGPRQALAHGFALAFLGFMIPIGDMIIPPLQEVTTLAILGGFNVLGMDISRDGFLLTTNAGRFDVAQACAGMRFLMAALMMATLFAYFKISEHAQRYRYIALAIALAIFANNARAFTMVLVATLSDMRYATGMDHYYFGWIIYLVMFLALYALGMRFADKREAR